MLPPPSFARSGATKQSSFLVAAQEAGLLRFARNDGGSISARSRDSFSPGSCQFVVPLLPRGRRESRAPTAPAAWGQRKTSPPDSHHEFSQSHRLSPRNGVTVSFVLSPVSGVFCHRCRTRYETGRIDATVAAPGPHDFAVRCLRSRPALFTPDASCVHRIPAQRIVTIANVPQRAGMDHVYF